VTGAELNSVSADGLFSVDATRCVGACGLAPVCIIDGRVIAQCTPQVVNAEIKKIMAEEKGTAAAD
ncbi:MAG: NAD(P)H-dependent oxidoreductase subunit E, partial [Solobacterium sp.]|nr:NAD(P)H-dependent oxidoreductase subunit E [Solobacterium sp.]